MRKADKRRTAERRPELKAMCWWCELTHPPRKAAIDEGLLLVVRVELDLIAERPDPAG